MTRSSLLLCSLAIFTSSIWADGTATVSVSLTPAGSFKGKSTKVTGNAYKTADGVAAENISVDLRDIKTGIDLRDKHTKKHLEIEKYPFAKLISATGKGGKGKAMVEVHGIKKEVEGTYKVEGHTLHASFKLHLPDVNITDISYMGVGVDDDVTIDVSVPIKDKK
jgi:hypothetical protein